MVRDRLEQRKNLNNASINNQIINKHSTHSEKQKFNDALVSELPTVYSWYST